MKILTDVFFKPTSIVEYLEGIYSSTSRLTLDILKLNGYKVNRSKNSISVNEVGSSKISYFLFPQACDDFIFYYNLNNLIVSSEGVDNFNTLSVDFLYGSIFKNDLYTAEELSTIIFYKLCYHDTVISHKLYKYCEDIILAYKDVRPNFYIEILNDK